MDFTFQNETQALRSVTGELGGLERVLTRVSGKIGALLAGGKIADYLYAAAKATGTLDEELSALGNALKNLRAALGDGLAPLLQQVLPILRWVIEKVTTAARYFGLLTQAVLGTAGGSQAAAQEQERLAAASQKAAKAAQRSLAAFDQLNRLQGSTRETAHGPGTGDTVTTQKPISLSLEELLFVGTLQNIVNALKAIDFSALTEPFYRFCQTLMPMVNQLGLSLEWLFLNVLIPLGQWAVERLLPLGLDVLTTALVTLSKTIEACRPAMKSLWEGFLKPMGQWAGEKLIEGLQWLLEKLEVLSLWMEHNELHIEDLAAVCAAFLAGLVLINGAMSLFNGNMNTGSSMVRMLTATMEAIAAPVELVTSLLGLLTAALGVLSLAWDDVGTESSGVVGLLRTQWQELVNWFKTGVLAPLKDSFRSAINSIIGFFNSMLRGITDGINGLIRSLNRISFTVPEWIPDLGGATFGISLGTVSTPQIPYLAKGAVLPANRPFMAVVGDQRHGTNVEAPLETIQQALSLVLEDMTAGQAAGQEAVVSVLGQILEAVLGISLGDDRIAGAVDRYRTKMAVVTGGF